MLGEFCARCLAKYMLNILLPSGRWLDKIYKRAEIMHSSVRKHYFPLAFVSMLAHNYRYIHGYGLTPAHAPSEGAERRGCQPSAPGSCHRSSLSRQRVLRSERRRTGQIRNAAQRPGGWPCGGGGGPSLWLVPPGLLCHSSIVPARRPPGTIAAQARTQASAQAQRRSDGRPDRGCRSGWTDAQGRRTGSPPGAALWRQGASAQYLAPSASLSAARGKKTPLTVESAKPDAAQHIVQYELLRSQVIAPAGNVTRCDTATSQRGGVGLALLLNEGMPGWLKAVETVLLATPAPRAAAPGPALHQDSLQSSATPVWLSSVRHEVTALLASLVLSTRPAVHQPSGEGYRAW